jgi:hypothetical protein
MANALDVDGFLLLQRDIDVCALTHIRAANASKAKFQDLEVKVRVPGHRGGSSDPRCTKNQ